MTQAWNQACRTPFHTFMYKQSHWCQSEFPCFSYLPVWRCFARLHLALSYLIFVEDSQIIGVCPRNCTSRYSISRYSIRLVVEKLNTHVGDLTFSISRMIFAPMFSIVSITSCENNWEFIFCWLSYFAADNRFAKSLKRQSNTGMWKSKVTRP